MTSSYRVSIQMDMTITDEDAVRQVAHEEIQTQLAAGGGVKPNEFVDNDQQAADFMTQQIRAAVSMAVWRGLGVGMGNVPGVQFANIQIQNKPQ